MWSYGRNMTGINRRFFDGLMADKKMSLRALASRMDMSHSSLSLTFHGARRMTLEEAAQISQIFNIPVHEVMEAIGISTKPVAGKRVSVIGTVGGDGIVSPVDGIERTNAPPGLPDDAVAIQWRTTGSQLDWGDGCVSFFDQSATTPVIGRLSYCQIKNGPTVVAMLRRGYREGTHNLAGPYHQESAILASSSPLILTRN